MQRNWQPVQHWFEFRFACSWMWLLPILFIIGVFLMSKYTYDQEQAVHNHLYNAQGQQIHEVQTKEPAYAMTLRSGLELFLPLISLTMTLPLLAQEWQQGSITQLALRKRLWLTLFERLTYVLLYLITISIVATIIAYKLSASTLHDTSLMRWVWESFVTVIPTTLAVSSIALLVAHLTMSVRASYIVLSSWWIANITYLLFVAQSQTAKTNGAFYTWFGWLYRGITLEPERWRLSKAVWISTAVVLLIVQIYLLRNEARYIHSIEE